MSAFPFSCNIAHVRHLRHRRRRSSLGGGESVVTVAAPKAEIDNTKSSQGMLATVQPTSLLADYETGSGGGKSGNWLIKTLVGVGAAFDSAKCPQQRQQFPSANPVAEILNSNKNNGKAQSPTTIFAGTGTTGSEQRFGLGTMLLKSLIASAEASGTVGNRTIG